MNIEEIENNEAENTDDNEQNDIISEEEIKEYIDSSKDSVGCKKN